LASFLIMEVLITSPVSEIKALTKTVASAPFFLANAGYSGSTLSTSIGGGRREVGPVDPQGRGSGSLGVQVNQKRPPALQRQRGPQADGRCRLTRPALVIDDGQNHEAFPFRLSLAWTFLSWQLLHCFVMLFFLIALA